MRSTRIVGIAMIATAFVVVAAMSMFTVNTGFAGGLDSGLSFFAQKSNGQGQNGNNPPKSPGTGNNGQGQGQENGNPPAENPGQGNENPGQGNNGQGNENQGQGNGNAPTEPDDADTDENADEGAEAADNGTAKVNVCHVTDKDTGDAVMISISERAVPAHEGHGDTLIGVASEDECAQAEAPVEPEAPEATPIPDDGEEDEDNEAPPVDTATPDASPMATPDIG